MGCGLVEGSICGRPRSEEAGLLPLANLPPGGRNLLAPPKKRSRAPAARHCYGASCPTETISAGTVSGMCATAFVPVQVSSLGDTHRSSPNALAGIGLCPLGDSSRCGAPHGKPKCCLDRPVSQGEENQVRQPAGHSFFSCSGSYGGSTCSAPRRLRTYLGWPPG